MAASPSVESLPTIKKKKTNQKSWLAGKTAAARLE